MTTYYQVLELSEQATAADIRRAYLHWVRLTHPDRTPDPAAHARYLLVNEAYDTLSHPERRARYDARLRGAQPPALSQRPSRPFSGNAYQVLRVPYSASPAQIEQAYRRWKQTLHQNLIDPAMRKLLADVEHAYATLRDPELRRLHHEHLRTYQPPKRPSPFAAQYARAAPVARWLCRAVFLFGVLLLLDSLLTVDFAQERVVGTDRHFVYGRGGSVVEVFYWVKTQHAAFRSHADYAIGSPLHIRRSMIFRLVRTYQSLAETGSPVVAYATSKLMYVLPVFMTIMAALGAWPGATHKRAVDSAFPATGVALLILYFLTIF
ncbi:J domain-containing protein [Hymenobacter busanensis]|uniref:J domain-containing protein n=1 Tax=Hymenobacter busanensis TaxID=2607656 RepID=UPI001366E52A|nr:J domain-containing protein [Hymenobacter busanensis]QHJ07830.1 DnaJ domain-containing protein [Hymenobacter busanensis]